MPTPSFSAETRRWFFMVVAVVVLYLSWRVVEPFAMTLVMAAIAAVVLVPLEARLRKLVRHKLISSTLTVLIAFLIIFIPFVFAGIAVVQQAGDLVSSGLKEDGFLRQLTLQDNPVTNLLPEPVRTQLAATDLTEIGRSAALWILNNLGGVLSVTLGFVIVTFFFFIFLYYFIADRQRIRTELIALSPFKDREDADIISRMISAVRAIVFGALLIALIKGALTALGMAIFGVPGWMLWGALTIIASQVPLVGVAIVIAPAVLYLAMTGHPAAAVGLAIWGTLIVGLVDNVLSPILLQGRTKMPSFLILIFILGGIALFDTAGIILGPTILAALLVVVELYKKGALEKV